VPDTPTVSRPNPPPATQAADEGLFCPQCGYSLRGLGGGGPDGTASEVRCPECGFQVNLQTLHQSIIPWVHRREIGRWRAYWRTVRLVSGRPRLVAGEASKPLRIEDAVGFRRVTALLAFLPLAALLVWGYVGSLSETIPLGATGAWGLPPIELRGTANGIQFHGHALGWLLEWSVVAALLLGLWLFVLAITGLPSYFFHPRQLTVVQQNRAVALSYFSCAALAWTPVSVGLIVGGALLASHRWAAWDEVQRFRNIGTAMCAIGGLFLAGEAIAWYADILAMLKRATYGSTGRVWAAAVTLPLLTVPVAVVTLVLLPLSVAMLALLVISLR
jgi:hypothetical protein